MIMAFDGILKASSPARVVNVASYWAGGLRLDDLQFSLRRYNNDHAYRQSKQADRMLTVAFARRFVGRGITVNACHSGDVSSTLSNDLGFGGHESPDQGASTPVWLATDPIGQEITGKYFEHERETCCRFGQNLEEVEKLFQDCTRY
jgi:NAD(P)-dependent dehydrogenase (short-subunit alcohol dehydrogenase family)